ncbi:hypothetical protein BGZ51_005144 [Haplosporangium sp. Z 767]|nr:hypothetical protein BGZ51_005144 [Haplosporangium sp. Z 767]KAF9182124.1 hypothetical protein BGZ50_005114 [Haplosporangium sp. Z 11]
MSSQRVLSPSSSSTSSPASTSPSFFPRPVFASDLVAQKSAATKKSASPPILTQPLSTGNSSNNSTAPITPTYSMMDLSSKLGELPAIHLPDFHLPDLQRLKQQLHKHTPTFSLKSLQHTFHVPSYSSTPSSSPSPSPSISSSMSSVSNGISKRLSLSSRSSRPPSTGAVNKANGSEHQKQSATPPSPISASASAPISIPTHPSNYLVKKQPTLSASTAGRNAAAPTNGPTDSTTDKSLLSRPNSANSTCTPNTSSSSATTSTSASIAPVSASKSPVGHLYLQVVEARNLTLVNTPSTSRPYCLVEYDQNELMTPPALPEADSMSRRGGNDIFARAMAASSPKWRYDAEFDVVRSNQQISITIYDSGAEDGQEPSRRFLGQVKLKPSEVHNRMIDSWFRLQGREDNEQVTGEIRVTIKYQAIESRHLSIDDFDILRVLGVGSFGKVYQVRKKDTGRIYAMKVLVKKQIIEQKQVEHTIAERNVLVQALQSPFIVGLKFSFQTTTKLYLVQDFMNGGELFFHMQNEGTFSEPRARFYAAELVLALEHLHSCNVVYRDLKPENILLSSEGHLVLVDFGLCKQNMTEDERAHTFCGTTEYLAPEIVKGTGYGKSVDWWSLGVLLFEMLVGTSPFADSRTEGTYHKILHQPVIFPSGPGLRVKGKGLPSTFNTGCSNSTGISHNAQDLIQKLLDKNPKTRLGSGPNGAEAVAAIKAHPFFKGIDFKRLQTRDVTPPFQPHVGVMGDLDVSNFDAQFTDQSASLGMGKGSKMKGKSGYGFSPGASISSPSSSFASTTLIDSQAGSFLLQQQQKAANLYRQQQLRGDNTTLSPNIMRGRRSSSSWSSCRTPSMDSLLSINDVGSPSQTRSRGQQPLHRTMASYKTRALQQQQQQRQQQQEFFKGFTFEGESILETLKRQEDGQQRPASSAAVMAGMDDMDDEEESLVDGIRPGRSVGLGDFSALGRQRSPNELFSGEAGSVDSIFGSM